MKKLRLIKLKFWKILPTIFIVCIVSSNNAQAHQGRGRFWLGFNAQKSFCEKEKWLWSFNSQVRFTKQRHPFNAVFAEPMLGYQFPTHSFWFGYRLTQHLYNRPSRRENRLIQQLIFSSNNNQNCIDWTHRFRLEEGYRSDRKQLYLRLRQRLAMELTLPSDSNNKPYIYNELFLMLNKTNFTSHRFISENRFFLGFNLYLQKTAWWEIGYMLQYLAKRPRSNIYQLNHILSVNLNYR